MQKSTGILVAIITFLAGALLGFLMAPAKKGVMIGNNCGNHYSPGEDWNEGEWDDEDDCCECTQDDDMPF